jgi:hypothetical protein
LDHTADSFVKNRCFYVPWLDKDKAQNH